MKKVTLPIAAIALVGLYAGTASAQCAFDGATAKGIKGSMVRFYAACGGSESGPSNTQTDGATDACTPVTPREVLGSGTDYKYGPKGKCSVSTSSKIVKDCQNLEDDAGNSLGLQTGDCHITYVKSKCGGIVQNDGTTEIGSGDSGWKLATLTRATLDDDANGDMTVINFPVNFDYSIPDGGKMAVDSNSAEALIEAVGPNNAELPVCTTLEIVDVVIKDPAGLPFARLGSATRE